MTEVRAPGMSPLQLCLALHDALYAPNSIREGGRSSQGCRAQPDSTLVHPVLPDQVRLLSLPTKRSPQEEEQSLEMLELPPLASGPVSSQSPLGAQGHTKDIHALWSVSTGAPCELELLTALKADMRNITILVPTHPSAGLQNIYINYGYIYCLCVVGHKQMCLAGGRSFRTFAVTIPHVQGPVPTGAAEPTLPGRGREGPDAGHREEVGLRLSFHPGFAINFECLCVSTKSPRWFGRMIPGNWW